MEINEISITGLYEINNLVDMKALEGFAIEINSNIVEKIGLAVVDKLNSWRI